jgi:hypothetical protein
MWTRYPYHQTQTKKSTIQLVINICRSPHTEVDHVPEGVVNLRITRALNFDASVHDRR